MSFFKEPSVYREHIQWNSLFSAISIAPSNQSQLFSNFGSRQDHQSEEIDINSLYDDIAHQLSFDVLRNTLTFLYSDSLRLSRTANCQRKEKITSKVLPPLIQPSRKRLGTNHGKFNNQTPIVDNGQFSSYLENVHRRTHSVS